MSLFMTTSKSEISTKLSTIVTRQDDANIARPLLAALQLTVVAISLKSSVSCERKRPRRRFHSLGV